MLPNEAVDENRRAFRYYFAVGNNATNRSSPVVTEDAVVARCRFFSEVQLWPRRVKVDPYSWMSNFVGEERKYATYLLNGFLFFSRELVERLFAAAFQSLSQHVVTSKNSFLTARGEWRRFGGAAVIVRVTGETPSDADSGYIFTRMARDHLGIPENRIFAPDRALSCLIDDPTIPVVFVDDFVGSGNQFVTLWRRRYALPKHGLDASFAEVSPHLRAARFYYCPLVCTQAGRELIASHCPEVVLRPAHLLLPQFGVLHPDSIIWPDTLRSTAADFIRTVSERAGIPDSDGGVDDWRGFHKLGLAIAFDHGMPDASLPLFTWNQNGWHPLLKLK